MYVARRSSVETIERKLQEAEATLRNELVPKLVVAFPERTGRKFNFAQQSRAPIGALRLVGLVLKNMLLAPDDPILRVNC